MGKLNDFVRKCATEKIGGKYNLPNFKAERKRLEERDTICKKLVALSDAHKVPMSFLCYFAVSKESHKVPMLEKSIARFNEKKALDVIKMSKRFAEYNGYKTPTDKVYHAMCAFYERMNADYNVFVEYLQKTEPSNAYPTAKAICQALGMM